MLNTKKFNKFGLVSGLALLFAHGAFASLITIDVVPTLAPNVYGSPSWSAWVQNSLSALEAGASSAGTPGTPSYYQAVSGTVDSGETIVTGFNSWLGQLDPASPYDQELGNRMHFGLAILGNGTQFSISELGFDASSNDAGDVLGFGGVAAGYGPGGYNYNSSYVGVIYGTGGNPDQFITSGPSDQLVDALFSRGSGNSEAALCTGICDAADQQDAMNAAVAAMSEVTQFTGTYYLSTNGDESGTFVSGSGTFDINPTPEPATWLLLIAGIPAIMLLRRRASSK